MLLIDRLGLEGGTRVTASARGGGSAPEAHQQLPDGKQFDFKVVLWPQ